MSNRKYLRKIQKRENSIALREKSHPSKKKRRKSAECLIFEEIDKKLSDD